MANFGLLFKFVILCSLIVSCSPVDKSSQQRREETLERWYKDQKPGSLSRRLSMDLLFQARNDRYLDSFPVLHVFSFDNYNRFTHRTFTGSKKKSLFYAGEYMEKADTIFLIYYQGAHPNDMATFLLKDSIKKVLLYPIEGTNRRVPLDVRYTIFDIR